MNKKQCQKCGEENPPEAVMCWACYTPLGSGVAASAAAPTRTPAKEEAEKKAIPMWQMAVVGLALVVGIFFGYKTLMPAPDIFEVGPTGGGGTTPKDPPPPPVVGPFPPAGDPSVVPLPAPPVIAQTPGQPTMRVEVVASTKFDVGTMGIVPNEQNVDSYKAASLALLAHRSLINAKYWKRIQIYVFSDQQAAVTFRNYQNKRKGAPLEIQDFQNLVELWKRTPAVYEFYGKAERWVSPAKSPSDWWTRWPRFGPRSG